MVLATKGKAEKSFQAKDSPRVGYGYAVSYLQSLPSLLRDLASAERKGQAHGKMPQMLQNVQDKSKGQIINKIFKNQHCVVLCEWQCVATVSRALRCCATKIMLMSERVVRTFVTKAQKCPLVLYTITISCK